MTVRQHQVRRWFRRWRWCLHRGWQTRCAAFILPKAGLKTWSTSNSWLHTSRSGSYLERYKFIVTSYKFAVLLGPAGPDLGSYLVPCCCLARAFKTRQRSEFIGLITFDFLDQRAAPSCTVRNVRPPSEGALLDINLNVHIWMSVTFHDISIEIVPAEDCAYRSQK